MKHLLPALCIGVLLMSGCATTHRAGAPDGAIDVIAHRGASCYAPENTLAAFRLAHEMKADWFELDCTLTQDGHVIVIHDNTVDRTTNAQGAVADLSLDELQKLDAGTWKAKKFAGEPLPTLDQALDLAKGRIGVYIEIKDSHDDGELKQQILDYAKDIQTLSHGDRKRVIQMIEDSGSRNLQLTRDVIELVRARRMEREIVIQSFSPIVCAIASIDAPDLRVEFLAGADREKPEQWESALRWCYLLDVDGFNTTRDAIDPGRLAAFHQAHRTVAAWTVNDSAGMRQLATWGVDAIITDRPDLCRKVLREMGKR